MVHTDGQQGGMTQATLPGSGSRRGWTWFVCLLSLLGPWVMPGLGHTTPLAYITNFADNVVIVIDTATNTVVHKIDVTGFARGVAVHPAGTFVYAAHPFANTISVIDTAKNKEINIVTVPIGSQPEGLAVNPVGIRLYVANYVGNSVSVIDTVTQTVLTHVPVGSKPFGVAVHPAGTRVYVAHEGSDSVSVIDATTAETDPAHAVIATVPVEHGPRGVAVHPNGRRVYVANGGSNSVSVIDTFAHAVIVTIDNVSQSPEGVAIQPDGKLVYVTNKAGAGVSVIDTVRNEVVDTVQVGRSPAGVAVRPDGKLAYIANSGSNTVSVIDTATRLVTEVQNPDFASPTAFGQFIGPLLPGLSFSLHKGSFHQEDVHIVGAAVYALDPGPTLRPVEVSVDQPSDSQRVDVYVAIQLPDSTLLFLQADGTLTTEVWPLLRNWAVVATSGELFRYTFGGTEPSGRYKWLGAFTTPGTLQILGLIAQAPFTFSP